MTRYKGEFKKRGNSEKEFKPNYSRNAYTSHAYTDTSIEPRTKYGPYFGKSLSTQTIDHGNHKDDDDQIEVENALVQHGLDKETGLTIFRQFIGKIEQKMQLLR